MAYDTTLLLVGGSLAILLATGLLAPQYLRFAVLPVIAVAVRLGIDLPRYWRFAIIVTTRRLFVNVGTVRDIYHTINLKHVVRVDVRANELGRALRYGVVELELEGESSDGQVHRGTYLLDYVRRPYELCEALGGEESCIPSGEAGAHPAGDETEERDVPV